MTIDNIEHDIAEVLKKGKTLDESTLVKYGSSIALKLDKQLTRKREERDAGVIRASEIGMMDTCPRKFWFNYYAPEQADELEAHMVMKFLYGDFIEETVLLLARAAGHKVEREQEEIELDVAGEYKIVGHIDAVIDGVLVDVKSTSTYGMRDFAEGKGGDKFGYRAQLNVYQTATGTSRKGWLVVDKTIGATRFFEETKPYNTSALIIQTYGVLKSTVPPARRLPAVFEANGNAHLGMECSYCPYKRTCWKDANGGKGLRTFAYSTGHKSYVHIEKEPRVPEV